MYCFVGSSLFRMLMIMQFVFIYDGLYEVLIWPSGSGEEEKKCEKSDDMCYFFGIKLWITWITHDIAILWTNESLCQNYKHKFIFAH